MTPSGAHGHKIQDGAGLEQKASGGPRGVADVVLLVEAVGSHRGSDSDGSRTDSYPSDSGGGDGGDE